MLAKVSPAAYLPKLVRALNAYGPGFRDRPDVRLALDAEAAEAARRLDVTETNGARLLCQALHAYQHALFFVGRRKEGLAVCEELAEVGRRTLEQRAAARNGYGRRLAAVLAEEGRHGEAADVCALDARAARSGPSFGDSVARSAELDAAGRHGDALDVFAELVDATRRGAEEGSDPQALLVWALVHRSRMLDAAGHCREAGADRREVLTLLDRLARTGDSGDPGDLLPGGPICSPCPAGPPSPPHPWRHRGRRSAMSSVSGRAPRSTRTSTASRPSKQRPPRLGSGGLSDQVTAHYRLTLRSGLFQVRHPQRFEESLRPLFDEGVALARRLPEDPGASVRALTDRAMFLVAAKRYEEAHSDFAEAVALLARIVPPSIVTRT